MEIFKNILGFENIYQISNFGNVKSLSRVIIRNGNKSFLKERILKTGVSSPGYLQVCLHFNNEQKNYDIHRLVAIHFVKNTTENIEVNHIDGNRFNNNYQNLEWVSRRENNCHKQFNKNNTSEFIGVYFEKKKKRWVSQIGINGKVKKLGRFKSELEAYQVRVNFEKQNNISNRYL